MGAWGVGLFQDDTACEVRDAFVDLIADGFSDEEATAELVRQWGTPGFDPDEYSIFWIALAATQFSNGRLVADVRQRAIDIIDAGEEPQRFFDQPKLCSKRQSVLRDLKARLLGPQRKPRRIVRRVVHTNKWDVGSVLSYRLKTGRIALFRVTGHHIDKGGKHAWVEILEGVYDSVPSEMTIALTRARRNRQGLHFRLFIQPEYELSERLILTDRGRSFFASIAQRLRDRSLLPGHYSRIVTQRGIDDELSSSLGLA